ncbi:hypothetical protein CRG98_013693 [Punica granatum]|uniref:Uncharacterized protein n=2 Tax=Punica granatum TaxID=22663 RepID=A0A2I0KBP1_PUNGR|nr:hypothetical protein CRG98_013693 [Punica granatum]
MPHEPGHPDLSRTPFLTELSGPAPLTSRRPPKTGLQAPRNHQGHGTSFRRSFGTLQGSPRDVSVPISLKNPLKLQSYPPARLALAKAKTGRNHRKTTRFSIGGPQHHVPAKSAIGSQEPLAVHTESSDLPFLPTTSASRAITFQGFLTTLTLPLEEVVTIREIRRQRDASIIQHPYFPEHPTDEERAFSATSAYVARFYPQGSTPPQRSRTTPTPRATSTLAPEAESSIQAAMHAKLRAVREERDRLRYELVDSRAEVADYRELQTELTRACARVAHLDQEMARLSSELDRVHKRARNLAHP